MIERKIRTGIKSGIRERTTKNKLTKTKPQIKPTGTKEAKKTAESKDREVVVPGQVVAKGLDFLPGDGTIRQGQNIIAIKFGLLDTIGRLVKVIPVTGAYYPKKDDIIIGKVIDITPIGWVISFGGPSTGFLTLAEGTREYVERNADLTKYYDFGDLVAARVIVVKPRSIDLSMKGPGTRKLEGGLVVKINTHKVPRVIGKRGSMINLIKEETNCNIVVGQNGFIWVKGRTIESELIAREAIKRVEALSHTSDLTEKIKDFLEQAKSKQK